MSTTDRIGFLAVAVIAIAGVCYLYREPHAGRRARQRRVLARVRGWLLSAWRAPRVLTHRLGWLVFGSDVRDEPDVRERAALASYRQSPPRPDESFERLRGETDVLPATELDPLPVLGASTGGEWEQPVIPQAVWDDAESESWDGPGIDVGDMIRYAEKRRKAAQEAPGPESQVRTGASAAGSLAAEVTSSHRSPGLEPTKIISPQFGLPVSLALLDRDDALHPPGPAASGDDLPLMERAEKAWRQRWAEHARAVIAPDLGADTVDEALAELCAKYQLERAA